MIRGGVSQMVNRSRYKIFTNFPSDLKSPENIMKGLAMELFIILGVILFVLFLIFGRKKKKKEKDQYVVIQERRTQVRNHVVKVPKGKKR